MGERNVDEDVYEEGLIEPEFVEEPADDLEASHEDGKIDSVELGFSKGYEEDKDHSDHSKPETEKEAFDKEDPFTEEDFDF